MKTPIRFLLTVLCAAFASVQLVHAAPFTVTNTNDSGFGSLRQAIFDSNATLGPDAIGFNIPMTDPNCNATTHVCTITPATALPHITDDVTITGPGANLLTVDANHGSRVFYIDLGKTVTISGLTITNGAAELGAGIYNDHATLTVSNSTLSGNNSVSSFSSGAGGGIYNDNATLTVTNSTLTGNSASSNSNQGAGFGAGIFNTLGTVTVTNSTVSGNSASGGAGGGIYNENATLTVTNSTVSGNSANLGGGICSEALTFNSGASGSATLTVTNSTVSGNSASGGGGIVNVGENEAGINNANATLTVTNSTVSGNSAGNVGGGGIFNRGINNNGSNVSAMLTVTNSTLSDNSAATGGGILNNLDVLGGGVGSATVTISSTILKAGASGANIYNYNDSGTVTSQGYNLSSDNASALLNQTTDQNSTNPMLLPLADNGGPTFTHALSPTSPAIDKGKNLSGSTTDQRGTGFARTVDLGLPKPTGGDGTDIGAFEVQALPPCPHPQGYWKSNPALWPLNALPMTLGSQSYTKTELLNILKTPANGDASIILAYQLIAAKLNIANGSDSTPVASTITHADGVLATFSGKLPYKVKTTSTKGKMMVSDASGLNNYNNGLLTSGCTP